MQRSFQPVKSTIVLTTGMLLACVPVSASVLTLDDGATHNLNYAVAEDDVKVYNSTTANLLTGGTIEDDLWAFEDSTVNVTGGTIEDDLFATDDSTVTITGGSIGSNLLAWSASMVNVSGGTIGSDLDGYDNSMVTVSGGLIGRDLYATNNSKVNVSGGEIERNMWARETSEVTVFGIGFNFGYGDYFDQGPLDGVTLTGTLANGVAFNNLVMITDAATVTLAAPATAVVPEPASIAMFGIGALGLFGYSRRRRHTSGNAS